MALCHDDGAMDARDIIKALGGQRAVAEATGSKISTVVSWEWRGFVPRAQIPALLQLARRVPDCPVTLDMLMGLVEEPAPRKPMREQARAAA